MAARVIANLVVAAGGVLIRAGVQAYRQAIVNAAKQGNAGSGPAASAAKSASQMSLDEAKKILGVESLASREELLRRYNHLFRANDEHGSFYLTSKVFRARERIEEEMGEPLEKEGAAGSGSGGGGGAGGVEEQQGPAKEIDAGQGAGGGSAAAERKS